MSFPSLPHTASAISALLLLNSATAQSFIDSFDDGPFSLTIPVGSNANNLIATGDPSEILGGQRGVSFQGDLNQAVPHSSAIEQAGTGYMDLQRNQNSVFQLIYGEYLGNPSNVNLQGTSNDRLAVNVLAAPGPFQLEFRVKDNAFFGSNEAVASLSGSGPGLYELSFSNFGAVEWDKIAGMIVSMKPVGAPNNGPGLYEFDYLAAVPEPSSIAFVSALGLLAFASVSRLLRGQRE